jgi:serine O-acetyltransferase
MDMLSLKQLLFSDLARHYTLEGSPAIEPSLLRFFCRLAHPRFLPVVLCRLSRAAMLNRIPLLPQMLTYLNVVLFGIEITPRCEIGPGVFFPHTSGTVIGALRIGANAIVYQGVTLGAKKLGLGFDPAHRPEVGDSVVLGAGAKILGGIAIGDNVTVGANSVVVRSVPANRTVAGVPAREISSMEAGAQ